MDQEDLWDIQFWENSNGKSPVESFFDKKAPDLKARVIKKIGKLRKKDINTLCRANDLEKLDNGLWELKMSIGKELRMLGILLVKDSHNTYLALHAFIKKENKIRKKEIDVALERFKQIKL